MIEFTNVTKVFENNGVTALKDVTFKINKGEFVFMIGPTGAGKTTAARLLLGEIAADSGKITVNGTDLGKIRRRGLPYFRRNIGMVFQDFRLLQNMTVFENIELAMAAAGVSDKNIRHMIPQILSLVNMEDKADAMPHMLSGGEKQRAAIARAMANNPPIMIADEPTGNLDPKSSREVMDLLCRFNKIGTTVLVITHDEASVNMMNKRVIELDRGRIVRDKLGGYTDDWQS